jgi:hypothetical protein
VPAQRQDDQRWTGFDSLASPPYFDGSFRADPLQAIPSISIPPHRIPSQASGTAALWQLTAVLLTFLTMSHGLLLLSFAPGGTISSLVAPISFAAAAALGVWLAREDASVPPRRLRGAARVLADFQYFGEPFGMRLRNAGVAFAAVDGLPCDTPIELMSVSPGYPMAVRVCLEDRASPAVTGEAGDRSPESSGGTE